MITVNFSGIRASSFTGRVLRGLLRIIPAHAVVPILQGPLRGKRWIAGSSNHGCWLGSYELDKQRLLVRYLRREAVFYDVGAHAGYYTLLAAHLVGIRGAVYSFEPLPANLVLLRRHVALNRLPNVNVIASAVSDTDGTAHFRLHASSSMGHLEADGEIEVPVVTLDKLVGDGVVRPPDLIKIDVEGAEAAVLRGCRHILTTYFPVVFLATHGDKARHDSLEILSQYGYSARSLDGRPASQSDEFVASTTDDT